MPKLHLFTYYTKPTSPLHMHSLAHLSRNVFCTASSTAPSTNSSDEPHSRIAMSKAELESCHWLKPLENSVFSKQSPAQSAIPLSSSYDCCFAAFGSNVEEGSSGSSADVSNGSVRSSSEPLLSHSSSKPSTNGSLHHSSSKHWSIMLNAIPSTDRLEAVFSPTWMEQAENSIERAIFDFRFLSLLAVVGSLAGSFLCFLKGCVFIVESYVAFYAMCLRGEQTGKMVLRLVEAVDVYLTGTVMLIFGMGLYGLFISNVAPNSPPNEDRALQNSSLFGMFLLQERPKWMRISSLDELKTKLGHVIVMILLVKMFERSKEVIIVTGVDLLSYSISIFLTSAALLVLRHLHH